MIHERHTGYPVLDNGDLVGIVTLEDVQERAPDERNATVRDVMTTDLVTISGDSEATSALRTLQQEDIGRILITEHD